MSARKLSRMMNSQDKNYLRYSDDFPGFSDECKDQAARNGYKMTGKIARAIWTELQAMEEPVNFTFTIAFEKHSIKLDK
jgi:hypothetical protein